MVNVLLLAVSVRPASLSLLCVTDRHVDRPPPPGVPLSNCLFFSFCDCNKSTLRKAILNIVCFYFMVINIVIIFVVPVDVFFLFSQCR